jgi:hypothetical protein
MENSDWLIRDYERKMAQEVFITDMKKEKFANDIKDGLGEIIKEQPNTIQKKPSFWKKLKSLF